MVSFPLQHRATPLTSTSLSLKISTHVVLKVDPGTADDIDFIPDDWFFWFLWKQKKDKNHSNVKKRRNEQKIVNKNKNKAERINCRRAEMKYSKKYCFLDTHPLVLRAKNFRVIFQLCDLRREKNGEDNV